MLHLYTQTLNSSLRNSLVEEWTSSVEASLVNHFQQPDDAQETKTQDTCGPTSLEELNAWEDLPLFCSRTLKVSLAANSKGKTGVTPKVHLFSSMSLESWKGWVTTQRQEYSQRVKSVRPTKENECSSWVVAQISESGEEILFQGCLSEGRDNQPQPTPPQEEQSSTLGNPQESISATPMEESKTWSTPTTRDYKGMYPQWSQEDPNKLTRRLLPDQAHMGTYKGKLNPRWVEALMGLPIGWVLPSCTKPVTIEQMSCDCLGTESSQTQQSGLSESCGAKSPKSNLWNIPPAEQRGDTVEIYLRRSIKRLKNGDQPFAPPLQVAVGLEALNLSTGSKSLFSELDLSVDTETLIKQIINNSYEK